MYLWGQHADPVDVAPGPLLARFKRADDRVPGCIRVSRGVPVRRLVTAADVPAFEADAKVEPLLAGSQAILASVYPLRQLADSDVMTVTAEDHWSAGSSCRCAPS